MKLLNLLDEKNPKVCAFTGHRELGENFYSENLFDLIKKAVDSGFYTFLNGMAAGFDLLAAEFVLTLKQENPKIKLIACIPCPEQNKYFNEQDKMRYHSVLICADEQILLSENYHKDCMLARDRYMAEHADMLIAYCRKRTGGTAYTLRYFQKIKPNNEIWRV